jgi:hypothetical protein
LSDKKVLARIPLERRDKMRHNYRDDVVLYLNEWANQLEEELLPNIKLDLSFMNEEKVEANW